MRESFTPATPTEVEDPTDSLEGLLVPVEKSSDVSPELVRELCLAGGELREIGELLRGLERSIIDTGLQVMADQFGADALLHAMEGSYTIRDVVDNLAPARRERKALIASIQAEPIDALANNFNETLGGVATVDSAHDTLQRARKFGVFRIESGKDSDEARELLSPALGKLLTEYPDIAGRFSQTNNTLLLLQDIRDVYTEKYNKLSLGIENAKGAIEAKITKIEEEAAELLLVSDDIHSAEIAALEERLATTSSEASRKLIEDHLSKKASEVLEARAALDAQYGDVRQKTISDLKAGYLYNPRLATPAQTKPTF